MIKYILLTMLMVTSVSAATINLVQPTQTQNYGVYLDEDYYVVTIEEKKVTKIELNPDQEVQYVLSTTKEEILKLIQKYPTMSKLELILYLRYEMNIPIEIIEQFL